VVCFSCVLAAINTCKALLRSAQNSMVGRFRCSGGGSPVWGTDAHTAFPQLPPSNGRAHSQTAPGLARRRQRSEPDIAIPRCERAAANGNGPIDIKVLHMDRLRLRSKKRLLIRRRETVPDQIMEDSRGKATGVMPRPWRAAVENIRGKRPGVPALGETEQ
jgi:hypothetical protein